jgi:hypothetical protein
MKYSTHFNFLFYIPNHLILRPVHLRCSAFLFFAETLGRGAASELLEDLFGLSKNLDAPLLHEVARKLYSVIESSGSYFIFIPGATPRILETAKSES